MRMLERRWAAFGGFAVVVAALYPGILSGARSFCARDIQLFYYPMWRYAAEQLRAGHLPLWNPLTAFGAPFLANTAACVLYPLNALWQVGDFSYGFNLYLLTHIVLAGFFTYLWMRDWGAGADAAFLAGLAYALSGPLLSSISLAVGLCSAAYLPLVLFCARRAVRYRTLKWTAATSAALVLQYLAGDVSIFAATAATVAAALCIRKRPRQALLIAGIAAGIAAVQLLPAIELLRLSDRAGASDSGPLQWSLPLTDLPGLFVPFFSEHSIYTKDFFSRQSFLVSVYLGITTWVLASVSIGGRGRGPVRWHAGLLGFGIFLALGSSIPFYAEVHRALPVWGAIRFPVRFIFLSAFAVACLAGLGWSVACKEPSRTRQNALRWAAIVLAGLWIAHEAWARSLCEAWFERLIRETPRELLPTYFTPQNLYNAVLTVGDNVRRSLALAVVSFGVLSLAGPGRTRRALTGVGLAALLLADLGLADPSEPAVPRERFFAPTPFTRALSDDPGDYRVTGSSGTLSQDWKLPSSAPPERRPELWLEKMQDRFFPNTTLVWGRASVFSYGFAGLRTVCMLGDRLRSMPDPLDADVAAKLGIRYISSPTEAGAGGYVPVMRRNGLDLLKNASALPRASLVERVVPEADDRIAIERSISNGLPASRVAYLSTPPYAKGSEGALGFDERIDVVRSDPQDIEMRVYSRGRWLLLTDSFFPGWTASVDGREVPILKANGVFRAVFVPEGERVVRWRYRPATVMMGAITSAATLAALLWALLMKRRAQ